MSLSDAEKQEIMDKVNKNLPDGQRCVEVTDTGTAKIAHLTPGVLPSSSQTNEKKEDETLSL